MDAIRVLLRQHRAVEKLFQKFEEEDDLELKKAACQEIGDALAIHTTIEEKLFYPATKDARSEKELLEAVEEHRGARRMIAELSDEEDLDDAHLSAQVQILKDRVTHHVREEERELFPQVKKVLDVHQLDRLGDQLEDMSTDLKARGSPRLQATDEPERAAPV